jgi:hypothetical protein
MGDGAIQNPSNRILLVGTHKVTGRTKGNYITAIGPDRISVDVGVDGLGTFIDNGDNSMSITISLMPNSPSNLVLSSIFAARLAVPVVLKEKNGTTAGACARAMVTKRADVVWSDGSESRVWVLVTPNWQGVVGDMDPVELNSEI